MNKKSETIFDKSKEGKVGVTLPPADTPNIELKDFIDTDLLRKDSTNLPQLSEPEVVRHYVNLSTKNHHVDKDFYPLGSCTMKYNPKINDYIASLNKLSSVHPGQPIESIQGNLEIYYNLEKMLNEITGMHATTLQPCAGSHGELVGLFIIKEYHKINKNNSKEYILIPETAHGTNPASVILSGFKVRQLKTDDRGRVDMSDLKHQLNDDVAGLMLTQPNTLGLFEDNILEISKLIHSYDALMYMDGANLNALIGLVKVEHMGFDIVHINLHKTFSTPHGGGGPGAGPIAVTKQLKDFLPSPVLRKDNENYFYWDYNIKHTIGRIHSFFGNFLVLVRAYVYILSLGREGLKDMTKYAILNANYLKALLEERYDIPFSEGTLHEFVISGKKQKDRGVKVLDIAKALLDYGYHAPTIYFPNNVPEAMMIEPTESESCDTLNKFANTLNEIDSLISSNPEKVLNAPISTPVSRLDETKANREVNVKWSDELQN